MLIAGSGQKQMKGMHLCTVEGGRNEIHRRCYRDDSLTSNTLTRWQAVRFQSGPVRCFSEWWRSNGQSRNGCCCSTQLRHCATAALVDIFHAGSSLPGVLGFCSRVSASCKDIDRPDFCSLYSYLVSLAQASWRGVDNKRMPETVGLYKLSLLDCRCGFDAGPSQS